MESEEERTRRLVACFARRKYLGYAGRNGGKEEEAREEGRKGGTEEERAKKEEESLGSTIITIE